MARRRDGIAALDLMLLLPAGVAAFASAAVLGPVALIAVWLFRELTGQKALDIKNVERLLPTAEERLTLARYRDLIARLREARVRTLRMGLREGLSKRSDGMFNDTGERAAELNELLKNLKREQNEVSRSLSNLIGTIESRIDHWISARSAIIGARTAIIACLLLLLGLIQWQPAWLAAMGSVLFRLGVPLDTDVIPLLGAGACAAVVGFVIGFIAKLTRRDTLWGGIPAI